MINESVAFRFSGQTALDISLMYYNVFYICGENRD